jgi:hypothetical protein
MRVDWENIKYTLNEQTKEVAEELVGTFTQYPLKLAWAITIHKSQGLTFERVILDAQAAFAHGQVYVALSRCKSFEGIVLRSKIVHSSVKTDSTVKNYSEEAEKNAPDEAHLELSKRGFQQSLILELFDFSALKKHIDQLNRVLLEHERSLHPDAYSQLKALGDQAEADVFAIAHKFRPQIQGYFQQGGLPEENAELQARIGKAGVWFSEKLGGELLNVAKRMSILTDNKAVRKAAIDALTNLQREIFVKNACFLVAQSGFSAQTYLRVKANAQIDFQAAPNSTPSAGYSDAPKDTPHPTLYEQLIKWRVNFAETHDIEPYEVLLSKSLLEITRLLPVTLPDLRKVKGIGKGKSLQFGADIIAIVRDYCIANNLQSEALVLPDAPPEKGVAPKVDSKALSFEMFQSGKSIDLIAAERGFVRATIEGHLAHYVGLGRLDIFQVMEEADIRRIEAFFVDHQTTSSSEAKAHFGELYSYGQIKMVLEWIRWHLGQEE